MCYAPWQLIYLYTSLAGHSSGVQLDCGVRRAPQLGAKFVAWWALRFCLALHTSLPSSSPLPLVPFFTRPILRRFSCRVYGNCTVRCLCLRCCWAPLSRAPATQTFKCSSPLTATAPTSTAQRTSSRSRSDISATPETAVRSGLGVLVVVAVCFCKPIQRRGEKDTGHRTHRHYRTDEIETALRD